ncbi:MAG: cyclic nucleotide-binding domain-containing protein [Pirellulaceae bacterium]|nr:cyclic nucleotide-binding domain-containing protein [Pirellulaceae bacterium]
MPANVYFDQLAQRLEEEGLFARGEDGQLIRYVPKTQADYERKVKLSIDGVRMTIQKASPTKNAQGDVIFVDASGRTIPRDTTIYDAVGRLFDEINALSRDLKQSWLQNPVPTLCHQEHLTPVGVCRVCTVAVGKFEKDRKDPSLENLRFQSKLVPACVHPVEDGMFIVTLDGSAGTAWERIIAGKEALLKGATGERKSALQAEIDKLKERLHPLTEKDKKACPVEQSKIAGNVRVLLELLAGDHLGGEATPANPTKSAAEQTDLERLVERYGAKLGIVSERFPHRQVPAGQVAAHARDPKVPAWIDNSSPLIQVDYSKCILCDRCARSCTEVKENFVIARAGKGPAAHIAFDLGEPMGESTCVECGECMLSCPTSALTFRKPIESDWHKEETRPGSGKSPVTPAEMEDSELLRVLPWRYRQWNQSAIVRWRLKAGETLCRLGEYGATAYVLNSGEFGIWLSSVAGDGKPDFVRSADDKILGEMACMNQYPRGATVKAMSACDVFEIRRNVLFTLQRNPAARAILDKVYRQRALGDHLRSVPLFKSLSDDDRKACRVILDRALGETEERAQRSAEKPAVAAATPTADRLVDLVRVEPGQLIFRQGEKADCFYMIRYGYVKVSETFGDEERVVDYLGPNKSFGEIACLSHIAEVRDALPAEFQVAYQGRRTASCAALDDVEMVRIDVKTFGELVEAVPALKTKLIDQAKAALSKFQHKSAAAEKPRVSTSAIRSFTDQGLYNAQRLLVLDLEACTRCDECTKACSDTHGGVTRLIRDGLRFDKWLVAGSCRSCTDPYCLIGCPVDAIHRDGTNLEIKIENNCIGCGLCANNCPYGNINMHGEVEGSEFRYRATTCDLCNKIVGNNYTKVSCVHACPHEAAYRMTGEMLFATIKPAAKS